MNNYCVLLLFILFSSCGLSSQDEIKERCLNDYETISDTLNNPTFSIVSKDTETSLGERLDVFLAKINLGDSIMSFGSQYVGKYPPALVYSCGKDFEKISVEESFCFIDSILCGYNMTIYRTIPLKDTLKKISLNNSNSVMNFLGTENDKLNTIDFKNYFIRVKNNFGSYEVLEGSDTVLVDNGVSILVTFNFSKGQNCCLDIW